MKCCWFKKTANESSLFHSKKRMKLFKGSVSYISNRHITNGKIMHFTEFNIQSNINAVISKKKCMSWV